MRFKILTFCVVISLLSTAYAVVIGDNSEEVEGVIIGGVTPSGGNSSFNQNLTDKFYWKLDGTNAPPTANWNMGGYGFGSVSSINWSGRFLYDETFTTSTPMKQIEIDITNEYDSAIASTDAVIDVTWNESKTIEDAIVDYVKLMKFSYGGTPTINASSSLPTIFNLNFDSYKPLLLQTSTLNPKGIQIDGTMALDGSSNKTSAFNPTLMSFDTDLSIALAKVETPITWRYIHATSDVSGLFAGALGYDNINTIFIDFEQATSLGEIDNRTLIKYHPTGTVAGEDYVIDATVGDIKLDSGEYCNATECYSLADFLLDTTGSGNSTFNQTLTDELYFNVDGDNVTGNATFEQDVYGSLVFLGGAGRSSTSISSEYLRGYNGLQMAANIGYAMPSSGSITKMSATGELSTATAPATVNFQVRLNGVNVLDCNFDASLGTGIHNCSGTTIRGNLTFNTNDVISFYVAENIQPTGAIDIDNPLVEAWGYFDE